MWGVFQQLNYSTCVGFSSIKDKKGRHIQMSSATFLPSIVADRFLGMSSATACHCDNMLTNAITKHENRRKNLPRKLMKVKCVFNKWLVVEVFISCSSAIWAIVPPDVLVFYQNLYLNARVSSWITIKYASFKEILVIVNSSTTYNKYVLYIQQNTAFDMF